VEAFQDDGGRKFELWWTPPGGTKELVPMSNLFPPGQTPSKEELTQPSTPAAPPALPPGALQQVTIRSAGVFGGPDLFNQPRGVAVDAAGNIYVADTGNRRVHKLDPQGRELLTWGREGKGDGEFQEPFAVVVNSRGEVLVLDSISGDIQRFSGDGRFLGRLPNTAGLYRPRGMAIDQQDNLYIADTGGNRIVELGPGGQPLGTFGSQGTGPGQFDQPTDVALDGDGNMWVADTMSQRLQALDSQGQYRGEGGIGKADTFNGPHVIFSRDAIFVTDPDAGQVLLFSRDGALAVRLAAPGDQPGELRVPVGIAADRQGDLYVTEVGNNRIQKFTVNR
ncbi:MAG: NHL repeat-containing protein, partial [Chloroflexi bacterium]|nr:NHL repeat-containing protein [Chloroflexota bacterium]